MALGGLPGPEWPSETLSGSGWTEMAMGDFGGRPLSVITAWSLVPALSWLLAVRYLVGQEAVSGVL